MTARRPRDFDLSAAVAQPSFTPRAGDLPALLDLLAGAQAAQVERAIVRLGPTAVPAVRARLAGAPPPLRARLARLLGRLGADAELAALLADDDPRARRQAAVELGKLPGQEARLLAALERAREPAERRTLVEALGKTGGALALAALLRLDPSDDSELARIAARARLRLERTLSRPAAARIDASAAPARPLPVIYHCRAGLEEILAGEVPGARPAGEGRVTTTLSGPLETVLSARTMLHVGFPLPAEAHRAGEDIALPLARALTSPAADQVFRAFTVGAVRYRIAWAGGGHRRAATLRAALAVASARPDLVNDPTTSGWQAVVSETPGRLLVELQPQIDDRRFAYRVADVPAASHPTIAAALARVAGVRADDVVWDPFVGSGSELIERARLGPYKALLGSDVDPRALTAAEQNLAAAGVHARLSLADARRHSPPGVTLILTNPPMGRRVRGDMPTLLAEFVLHAGRILPPGGRLVWVSPFPAVSDVARRAGLTSQIRHSLDMGGFRAEIQRWLAPSDRL